MPHGQTDVHLLAEHGETELLAALLAEERNDPPPAWEKHRLLDLNEKTDDNLGGNTPLHLAAANGHLSMVNLLIHEGAIIDINNREHLTPLMLASINGHENVLLRLLKENANIQHADRAGWTALHWAAYQGNKSITYFLLQNKAQMNMKGYAEKTPVLIAAEKQHNELVSFYTHWAAQNNDEKCLSILADNNLPLSVLNALKRTPLHTAIYYQQEKSVEFLLKHIHSLDDFCVSDYAGNTFFHAVADQHSETILQMLVNKFLELQDRAHLLETRTLIKMLNQPNHAGRTPLDLADKQGHFGMIKALENAGAHTSSPSRKVIFHYLPNIISSLTEKISDEKNDTANNKSTKRLALS